jgi:hypothetical protein
MRSKWSRIERPQRAINEPSPRGAAAERAVKPDRLGPIRRRLSPLPIELATLVNVVLTFVPNELIAARHTTTIRRQQKGAFNWSGRNSQLVWPAFNSCRSESRRESPMIQVPEACHKKTRLGAGFEAG